MEGKQKCISDKWDIILKANKMRTEKSYLRDSEWTNQAKAENSCQKDIGERAIKETGIGMYGLGYQAG